MQTLLNPSLVPLYAIDPSLGTLMIYAYLNYTFSLTSSSQKKHMDVPNEPLKFYSSSTQGYFHYKLFIPISYGWLCESNTWVYKIHIFYVTISFLLHPPFFFMFLTLLYRPLFFMFLTLL